MKKNHPAFGIPRFLSALLTAVFLTVSPAGAESLFSLLATSTPAPDATPVPALSPEPVPVPGGLFDLLATATPGLTAAPMVPADPEQAALPEEFALFGGFGYGSMAAKYADRVVENPEEGTLEWIYEQVSAEDFLAYEAFLREKGCAAETLSAGTRTTVSCLVTHGQALVAFLLVYQPDVETLTLVPVPYPGPDAESPASGSPEPGAGNGTGPTLQPEANVCTQCSRGLCKECRGSGFFQCSDCGGFGRCPECRGKREFRSVGYGGVGTAVYTPCGECGGTGRCNACEGKGRVDCPECDHGICKYCGGDYFLEL